MKGRKLARAVLIIYVLFLTACSLSWLGWLKMDNIIAGVTHSVTLEAGAFKKDTEVLTAVIQPGETAKLDEFEALKTADLRGSDCTQEIYAWAQAHPEVTVYYDVALPGGGKAENNAQAVNFSGIGHGTLDDYMACLEYLPEIEAIDLGTNKSSDDPLTAEDITTLFTSYPDKMFSYTFELGGNAYSLQDSAADLSAATPEDVDELVSILPCMKNLRSIDLGSQADGGLSWADIAAIEAACPEAEYSYTFTLYGKSFDISDETIDLSKTPLEDNGDALAAALPALRCESVDLDSCGVMETLPDSRMIELRDINPDVNVVWRIWFGQLYSVRTDTERIFASKPTVGGMLDDNEAGKLACCTKVKYVDIGHNDYIYDLSFVSYMPELEVLIVAMDGISDISPLANCPKLEYLEIFSTAVADLSPLKDASALRHLNISCCANITDISPLYGLTELERLWIGTETPVPAEQVAQMQAAAPNCKISTVSSDPHGDAWRYTWYDENNATYHWVPRHELLREQLGYNYQEYSFYWLDPKCELAAPAEYAGIYYGKPD